MAAFTVVLGLTAIITNIQTCRALKEGRADFKDQQASILSVISQTKRLADSAREQFEVTERPHVSLGRRDGTLAEFVVPKHATATEGVGIKFYLQNGGRSPALTPRIGITLPPLLLVAKGATQSRYPFKPHSDVAEPLLRYKVSGTWNPENEEQSIAPQSEYVHLAPDQLSKEQYDATRAGKRLLMLFRDPNIATNSATTRIAPSISTTVPNSTHFFELNETYWSGFYKFPAARSDREYLPPCEQPDEREAREKKQREDFAKAAKTANLPVATVTPTP